MPEISIVALVLLCVNALVVSAGAYRMLQLSKTLRERELQVALLESQLERALSDNSQVYRPNYDDLATLVNLNRHRANNTIASNLLLIVLAVAVFIALTWTAIMLYQSA